MYYISSLKEEIGKKSLHTKKIFGAKRVLENSGFVGKAVLQKLETEYVG